MELFSVLSKEHCNYFLFVSIFSLIICMLVLMTAVVGAKEKRNALFFSSLSFFLMYYVYRLFYSMCEESLH